MVPDPRPPEDITQDVFMSALRRMRETDRPIIFKPWVYEIAKNACIDAFRRSKRAEEVSFDAEEGLGGSDYGRLASSTPTPDAAVDTRMSLDHLRGAFGGLSEMHHDILVMRELEGLSYREIGQRLGMSRPSVESTLFRARRRLTEEYEELTSGERCTRVQGLIADSGGRPMGVRDERKLARHVSYCQPCRRAAYSAGFDVAALAAQKSMREKIAALLPIPAFLKRRWLGGGGHGHGGGSVSKLTSAASQYAEPMSGWAKAAAVAATVAVAGAGAGVATTHGTDRTPAAPAQKAPAGAGLQPATAQKQAAGTARAARSSRGSTTTSAKASTRSRRSGSGARRSASAGGSRGSSSSKPTASGGSSGGGGAAKGAAGGSSSAGGGSSPGTSAASGAKNAVDKTAGAVNKTVNKTAGAINKTVDKTAGAVNKTVDKTAGAAKDTVGAATGAVDKVANGATAPVTGAVNGAVGAATGAANTAAGAVAGAATTATGAASDPVGTVTAAASDPVGTATGAVGGVLPGG